MRRKELQHYDLQSTIMQTIRANIAEQLPMMYSVGSVNTRCLCVPPPLEQEGVLVSFAVGSHVLKYRRGAAIVSCASMQGEEKDLKLGFHAF